MTDADPDRPPPDPAGPIDPEGQRAWLAQVDRKVGTRTYAGGAALVLTLATAIVALVMAIDARENSATQEQLQGVERQLGIVAEDAGELGDLQDDIDAAGERLDTLEEQSEQVQGVERRIESQLEVIDDDIEALRQQISDLDDRGND